MSTKPVSQSPASEKGASVLPMPPASEDLAKLRSRYFVGPIHLTGTESALYERHLLFDNVVDLTLADARERFEAVAHSVRDILSQRWIYTDKTYDRANPKRVYYLSMEFLIGRSLANNVTNLLLDPVVKQAIKHKNLDWPEVLECEPVYSHRVGGADSLLGAVRLLSGK